MKYIYLTWFRFQWLCYCIAPNPALSDYLTRHHFIFVLVCMVMQAITQLKHVFLQIQLHANLYNQKSSIDFFTSPYSSHIMVNPSCILVITYDSYRLKSSERDNNSMTNCLNVCRRPWHTHNRSTWVLYLFPHTTKTDLSLPSAS